MKAGPVLTTIASRIDDPELRGTSRAQLRELLSLAQILWSAWRRLLTRRSDYTLTWNRTFYQLKELDADIIRLRTITYAGRELDRTSLTSLGSINPAWMRMLGDWPRSFAPIGRSMVAFNPAPERPGISVEVVSDVASAIITDDDTDIEVPRQELGGVSLLTEALAHLRSRRVDRAELVINQLEAMMDGQG